MRIVPALLLAASLSACGTLQSERARMLGIGVAAAEFRVREARWPRDQGDLVRRECAPGRSLAALVPPSICRQEFGEPLRAIAMRARGERLHLDVRHRKTGQRCRMTIAYAGDERARRTGAAAQVRTSIFRCR